MAPSHRRSLSTPQRLLRKTLRKSLTSEEINALKSSRAAAIEAENRDQQENDHQSNDTRESERIQLPELENMATHGLRASAEPAKKRQRRNGQVDGADIEVDRLEIPQSDLDAENGSSSTGSTQKLSNGNASHAANQNGDIVTETPPGSPPPVMIKTEQGYHEFINSRTQTTTTDGPLHASDFEPDEPEGNNIFGALDGSRFGIRETELHAALSADDEDDEDDEDDRDTRHSQRPIDFFAAGSSNNKREPRKLTSPMNKVRSGRISKFREALMSDRPIARPRLDLGGFHHSVSGGTPRRGSSVASAAGFGNASQINRRRTFQLPRQGLTRNDQFSMTGFLKSLVNFNTIRYVKNNLVEPVRARFQDKLVTEEDKLREKADIDDIKQKAEEVYMIRRAKEAEQLDRQKQMGLEFLQRQHSEGLSDIERKRKYNKINGFEAENTDVTDSETKAYESEGSVDLPYHSFSTRIPERHQGSDNEEEYDHEAPLSDTELEKMNELVRSMTGKAVVVPAEASVRTPLASPRLGPSFLANDSTDAESEVGCNAFFSRNRYARPQREYAHSNDGNPTSRFNSFNAGPLNASQSFSHSFSQSFSQSVSQPLPELETQPDAEPPFDPSSSQSTTHGRSFTKRELTRQRRLFKRVSELEHRLLETWKELEAAGGLENLKYSSSSGAARYSQAPGQSINGVVAGGRENGRPAPRSDKGKERENLAVNANGVNNTAPLTAGPSTNGARNGVSVEQQQQQQQQQPQQKPLGNSMGPPPLPVRMSGGRST